MSAREHLSNEGSSLRWRLDPDWSTRGYFGCPALTPVCDEEDVEAAEPLEEVLLLELWLAPELAAAAPDEECELPPECADGEPELPPAF